MKKTLLTGGLMLAVLGGTSWAASAADKKPASAAAAQSGAFTGKVSETMNSGGYTYVEIDTGTAKLWAAAPQFAVKVGDKVAVADGMPMMR